MTIKEIETQMVDALKVLKANNDPTDIQFRLFDTEYNLLNNLLSFKLIYGEDFTRNQ